MGDKMSWALWNGSLMPLAEVRVPVLDRGYLFGDSVYEVIRLYAGRPFLLEEHERRLSRSLRELGIEAVGTGLRPKIARLVERSGIRDGSVYLQISRGVGPRSHVPPPGLVPNELLFVQELQQQILKEVGSRGIRAYLADDLRWGRCDIKTTNLLGNCLALTAAKAKGGGEALLVDRDGYVSEGTHASFFGVKGTALVTTPLTHNILPSITRAFVLELAGRNGIAACERRLAASEIADLDEAFFVGTISELTPVVQVDERVIGCGEPGVVTRRLQRLYGEAVAR